MLKEASGEGGNFQLVLLFYFLDQAFLNQTQMHCRNGGFLHIWAVCRSNVVGRIRGPGRGDTSVPTTQPQVVTWAFPFLFQGHCQGNIILPRIFEVL